MKTQIQSSHDREQKFHERLRQARVHLNMLGHRPFSEISRFDLQAIAFWLSDTQRFLAEADRDRNK